MNAAAADKNPTVDPAEHEAYFPSPYSLGSYTSVKTDFDGLKFKTPYTGGKWRVLMIGADERYLPMRNGKFFSTGNHPVEMLLPMHHMDQAGFPIDVATLSGNPVKLELWAMPWEDEAVSATYRKYLPRLREPKKLSDVLATATGPESPYIAVFVPGGHGALVGIPHSDEVGRILSWATANDKYVITLCHGPGCLLAAAPRDGEGGFPFKDYKICVFPDALDRSNPDIGYMPGQMKWLLAEKLRELGVVILNEDMTGRCHQDRKLITGDSPLASNNIGKLAAEALLKEVGL